MGCGFASRGKAFKARAIHDKDIEPAVIVVIVEGDAASRGFEQILVLVFTAKDGFDVQPGGARDIEEADAEIGRNCGYGFFRTYFLACNNGSVQPARSYRSQDALERQDQRGPAERFQKYAA